MCSIPLLAGCQRLQHAHSCPQQQASCLGHPCCRSSRHKACLSIKEINKAHLIFDLLIIIRVYNNIDFDKTFLPYHYAQFHSMLLFCVSSVSQCTAADMLGNQCTCLAILQSSSRHLNKHVCCRSCQKLKGSLQTATDHKQTVQTSI